MNHTLQVLHGQPVIVGLSGGVDSAVTALLLKRAGADVQALHMTNWDDDDGYCTAAEDLQDARNVCEQLAIPLHHINFAQEYRDRVFEAFLADYRAGRTPNPDVLCNREIKFGVFREYAHRLGATWLATGHYARIRRENGSTELWKGADSNKDQSYFLHAIRQEALAETVFPLGNLHKDQVRAIARDAGLATHDKKDSTGICFIGERPFREFLATYLPAQPGDIVGVDGARLGRHQGLMYHTLGQRQGLGIGGHRGSGGEPWYVAAKNLASRELIVVQGEHPLLYSKGVLARGANWIAGSAPDALLSGLRCHCKLRYRQEDQTCTVMTQGADGLRVEFDQVQRAVAPGQYVVFYAAEQCLGGAVIDETVATSAGLRHVI
ncbi:MAG: tRNA 2-thiouridine(34) synthase MnmA [Halioglobus sp.]|nr:tRNA 2-thiouridine(34) synthase MnmA [Halioglobus sp.]